MIETHAPAPARAAAADAERVLERIESAITRIGAIAGAAAGTVLFVATVGGAVMWLRFRGAGVPADHAVALVPRADLVVIGLRVMVLPVAAAGLLSATYLWWQRPSFEALDELDERERGLREALEELGEEDRDADARRAALAEQLAGARAEQQAVRDGRGLPAPPRLVTALGALLVVALLACVPFTPGALVWPLAALVLVRYHRRLCSACVQIHGEAGRGRLPRSRLAIAAMIAAAAISVARQLDPPVQLASVHVETRDEVLDGTLVTANGDTVALAPSGSRSIRVLPRDAVRVLIVGPPADRRAPRRSLLSHLLAGPAWAATPLDVWCGGEHYPWWRLGAACQTQPEVLRGIRAEGRSVVAVVRCPDEARDGCAGFVTATTERTFTADGAAQAVVLGRAPFTVRAGTDGALRVPMTRGARKVVARDGPRRVVVRVALSRDLAGEAPVPDASRSASVVVPPVDAAAPDRASPSPEPSPSPSPDRPSPSPSPEPSPSPDRPSPSPSPEPSPSPDPSPPDAGAALREAPVDPAAVPPQPDQAIASPESTTAE